MEEHGQRPLCVCRTCRTSNCSESWCGTAHEKVRHFIMSHLQTLFVGSAQTCTSCISIYIIISKNIRYLLWNRGARRFFRDTYLTIEVQGIRCTNHLHDSCPLTDVNPHFTAPGCRYYLKIGLLWRHRHMGQPLAIVTSQWSIVPTGMYGRMMLRSTRVKGIASTQHERWLGSGGWKVEIIQTINS